VDCEGNIIENNDCKSDSEEKTEEEKDLSLNILGYNLLLLLGITGISVILLYKRNIK